MPCLAYRNCLSCVSAPGATDAARAAADIVLTDPGLSVVIHAIIIARQIFQRVKNFINCEWWICVAASGVGERAVDWGSKGAAGLVAEEGAC